MSKVKEELTNPETARQFKHTGNWNRKINIPGVWAGLVQNIPPHAVEKLIEQGRKDFIRIKPGKGASNTIDAGEGGAGKENVTPSTT